MVRAGGGAGVGTANTFVSHAWTFVFEELIESLRLFEAQQLAAGRPPSYFWLDIFVVDENAAHTYLHSQRRRSFTIFRAYKALVLHSSKTSRYGDTSRMCSCFLTTLSPYSSLKKRNSCIIARIRK